MTMYRVDCVREGSDNYFKGLEQYVGKTLEVNEAGSNDSRSTALWVPGKSDYWYFDNEWLTQVFEVEQEQVHSPKHYNVLEDIEAIQIIASSMTQEMFKGYCLGNILKYRLRCGAKDDVNQELAKADKYKELFAKYKHLCKERQ